MGAGEELAAAGLANMTPVAFTQGRPARGAFNAGGFDVERLALAENEQGAGEAGGVVGFLPFPDRFAVEDDSLYMLGYSVSKGYELAEARATGPVKVHNLNPNGDSYAGFPHYDDRTLKGFDGKLFFYSLDGNDEFELRALKSGSALETINADPAGSDIRMVLEGEPPVQPGPGVVYYKDYPKVHKASHIQSLRALRERLMSAASLRVRPIDPDTGEPVELISEYDIEPQRIAAGKKPVAEIVDMYPQGTSLPRNMAEFNGAVYMIARVDGGFSPCAGGRDYELVRLNDDGSSEVVELNADGWAFFPSVGYPELTVYNGALYLVVNVDGSTSGRHELVRVSASHEVSVIPLNPDDGAFPDADQLAAFWTGTEVPVTFVPFDGDLVILGARVKGDCYPGVGCANPYENEVVRIDPAGSVSVIDFTPGAGSTFETFQAENLPPTFVASEFEGDLYFNCLPCNDWSLFRLNADGSHENLADWVVTPTSPDQRNFALGVERGASFYLSAFNQSSGEEGVLKIGGDGSFRILSSPDMGYGFVNNLTLFGDRVVASADIFTSPAKDFEDEYLGTELLVVNSDDGLGYVDVRPGQDMHDWPLSSWPQSFHVVGQALFFSSYGDETLTSEFHDLYRVTLPFGRKGPADPR